MTRRSFFHLAGVGGALLGAARLLSPAPAADTTAELQACLDAGQPLPEGLHVVSRTLRARGPVAGAGSGGTVLVAAERLGGPVVAGDAPFRASDLAIRVRDHHVRLGATGARVTRLG